MDNFLWVERHRPRTIAETVLPASLKATFQQFVDQKNIPNLLLSGPAGVGKTTVARAMLEELQCDYIVINGSMNGNIDTLRNEILNFASSVSFTGGRKYVILDEADYLNANSTQPALRNFMEEFSSNCGFILTCNFANRIIAPLHSRCSVINFTVSKEDRPKMAAQFMKRSIDILQKENIEFDKSVVATLIQKHFPDWRRVLNELQRYSSTGKIDSGILADLRETSIADLVQLMRDKNYTGMRKWVAENIDQDQNVIYRKLYDQASQFLKPQTVPLLVLSIAKYSYQAAFAADPEITMMACLTEIMINTEFL
jgi:DNA polymerase III delta prime subunit